MPSREGIKSIDSKYFCVFNADGSFDPNDLGKLRKNYMRVLISYLLKIS